MEYHVRQLREMMIMAEECLLHGNYKRAEELMAMADAQWSRTAAFERRVANDY